MKGKVYTTKEAAVEIGASSQTLKNWIGFGIQAPKLVNVGKKVIYLWTSADIERARAFKGALKMGRKSQMK